MTLIYKKIKENKIEYANSKHPLYETLKKVVFKHLGLEDIVETVISKMGNVKKIIVIGDYAEGIDSEILRFFLLEMI